MTEQGNAAMSPGEEAAQTGADIVLQRVAEGVDRLRLPLHFAPHEVNAWLIDGAEGVSLIDVGPDTPEVRAIWERLLAGRLAQRPVEGVIATHGHVDHVGLAGPLTRRATRPLTMTAAEWRLAGARRKAAAWSGLDAFHAAHGCTPDEVARFARQRADSRALVAPMPRSYSAVRAGDTLRIGGRDWRAITGGGHSPQALALYCAETGVLISGDQVLPVIVPIIGTYRWRDGEDPLGDYLASLDAFAALPDDTLVLPGHGAPFRGLGQRLREIAASHEARLSRVQREVTGRVSARDVARALHPRTWERGRARLALVETLALLTHLVATGRVARHDAEGGVLFAPS